MNKIIDSLFNICQIEELAREDRLINEIHPLIKIIVTILYVFSITSINKYDIQNLILYGIYPILAILAGNIDFDKLKGKIIVPFIFSLSFGVFNPLLDKNIIKIYNDIFISAGWLSFLVISIKSLLLIIIALILISTTKIEEIAYSFNLLKLPKIMSIQLILMFRYITILIKEFDKTITAYSMRSNQTAIKFNTWGSLIGQIFIKTSKKSLSLYESMKLRGFEEEIIHKVKKISKKDMIYLVLNILALSLLMGMRLI